MRVGSVRGMDRRIVSCDGGRVLATCAPRLHNGCCTGWNRWTPPN